MHLWCLDHVVVFAGIRRKCVPLATKEERSIMAFAARRLWRESFDISFVGCNGAMRSDLSSSEMCFAVSEDVALQRWLTGSTWIFGIESAHCKEIDEAHHKDDDP